MKATMTSKVVPAILLVLLLTAGGFLAGGVYGRLTIPPGQGLAGAGTAAILALGGAALGALLGVVIAIRSTRRWPWAGAALVFAAFAWVAIQTVPKRSLQATPYEPPPIFEPAFVFSLMADPNPTGPRDEALAIPFDRLDIGTSARSVRALTRDSTTMCTGDMPDFELIERARAAALAVRDECASDGGCTATSCRACAHYLLLFTQGQDSTVWRDISAEYLAAAPAGRTFVEELVRVYEGAQPWSFCGN